ncbi:MAG: DUF4136 domain-containing protein [Burkholderiaceae bacterium]|nr:DUF4136 domain-containing protein [Burkholderiaceae bacterium]
MKHLPLTLMHLRIRSLCRGIAIALLSLGLLAACASNWIIDSRVRAFAGMGIPAGATYRFERLPSQQTLGQQQEMIESLAADALARAGLRRDDAQPRYSIQLSARVQRESRGLWDDVWMGWGFGGPRDFSFGIGYNTWLPPFPPPQSPYYLHEVGLVMRELATGQIAYETRASYQGPWSDTNAVLAAMFEAALKDYPNPPVGVRTVNVEVGPKK